jgi:glycosyltransferase involved in cell wall biosynthesis
MTVTDRSVPKITMITAALNPGPEVRQTIESVLSQGYPNLEYIFVDGGSKPEAFAHVSPYLDRIDVLIREPDEGISDAWNKAIARVSGAIVGIINADDYLMPGSLDAVAKAFASHGKSPIVHGDVIRIEHGCEMRQRSTVPFWLMIRFVRAESRLRSDRRVWEGLPDRDGLRSHFAGVSRRLPVRQGAAAAGRIPWRGRERPEATGGFSRGADEPDRKSA